LLEFITATILNFLLDEAPKEEWYSCIGISMAGGPLDNDGNYSFSHTVAQSVIP